MEIADNSVSIFYNLSNTEVDLKVVQTNTNWTLDIVISKTDFKNYEVDRKHITIEDLGETVRFKTNLSEFNLKLIK